MGNIEPIEWYHPDFVPFAPAEPNVDWVAEPVVQLRGNGQSAGDPWTLLAELSGSPGEVANRLSAQPASRFYPFMSDPQAQLYQVTADGAWNDWSLPSAPPSYGVGLTPRRYLIVENYKATHLVCLPVPWISLRTDNELLAQILVRKRTAGDDLAITVTIRDPQIGAALG